jgi:hypothetical protein
MEQRKSAHTTIDPLIRTATRKYVYEATSYALSFPHVDPVELESDVLKQIVDPRDLPVCITSNDEMQTLIDVKVAHLELPDQDARPGHEWRELQLRVFRPATGGFGFTISGGYPKKVLVHKVIELYPAYGILQPEDQIIKVNNVDVRPLAHDRVLELFSSLPPNKDSLFTILRSVDGVILSSFRFRYDLRIIV